MCSGINRVGQLFASVDLREGHGCTSMFYLAECADCVSLSLACAGVVGLFFVVFGFVEIVVSVVPGVTGDVGVAALWMEIMDGAASCLPFDPAICQQVSVNREDTSFLASVFFFVAGVAVQELPPVHVVDVLNVSMFFFFRFWHCRELLVHAHGRHNNAALSPWLLLLSVFRMCLCCAPCESSAGSI